MVTSGGITMQYKEFQVKYDDSGNGSLEGYASTWIRKADSYGDVVAEGAFSRTLTERWNGGKGIPLLWAHQMDNLKSFIGTAEAEEDEKGLHFLASFDGTEEAQRVRELYKDGRLSKFSFAFDVRDNGTVTLEDGTKANELRDLELFEISCVCVPANDDAGIVAVKANVPEEPDVKAGRRNRKSDEETIKQIISLAQSLLDEVDDTEDPENGEDKAKANAAAEEPEQSNPRKDDLLSYIKNMEV
jgi:HK97 family phage prohead protease